jgi:MFS transporter, DHA2 family, multidrug resistance protein
MQALTGKPLILLTFSLSLAVFMNVLDVSIANVAIPTIAGDLAVSANQGTWIITSFAVSQAIMLPITGWLARRFGEVRLFLFSTLLFTFASVICGLSVNLPMIIVARIIQGAVSGPMIPLSQSILLANYPPEKRGLATGIWAMVAVVAPIFGPVLGGWLTDNYSWPWIFYINVPVGILATLLTFYILQGQETAIEKPPIDLIGLGLLIIAVGSLQILLDKGHDLDWFHSNTIIILALIAVIAGAFLIVWELYAENPIVDLMLFTNRNFLIGSIAFTLGFLVYFSNVVIFPLWLQTQMGYTPTWAGLATAPVGILPVFLAPIVGAMMHKMDLRKVVSFGFIVFALTSFWNSTFNTFVDYVHLIEPRILQGVGLACFFTPLISIILSNIPNHRVASALGLANFCRILGGSFGTSLSVTLWDRRESFHQSRLVENINIYQANTQATLHHLQSLPLTPTQRLGIIDQILIKQAYMLATNDIFWLSGCLFISLLIIIWFAKPPFAALKGIAVD